ncbi:hypothetical protein CASFOL_001562 [Castilleja foliolosa]|uniref:Photosystem I assembly protein Ycf4 n=1 Tax=Castilleja foliolosa TaxID=1961234 RepID=A0ABD3ELF1_9LAMI
MWNGRLGLKFQLFHGRLILPHTKSWEFNLTKGDTQIDLIYGW